jgi:glycosyltransferase involved in cell wall biosynthesis
MKILWFTWKDLSNPLSGGAELVDFKIAERLVKRGHEVKFITSGFYKAKPREFINGFEIIRVGNYLSVYFEAFIEYHRNWKNWADVVIEEINTVPFFTQFYVKEKRFLLIYQLCREIWFYQSVFPISLFGFLIEPIYLFFLRKNKVITESKSTKCDLQKYGFNAEDISIIPMASNISPIVSLNNNRKYKELTLLSIGSIRSMKRTLIQIKAFELSKKTIASLKMIVAGSYENNYGLKVKKYIENSIYKKDILFLGKIDESKKMDLMSKSHLIVVSSVKEGWCLVVTEAAAQGTPAVVCNSDGLKDSVIDGSTGLISKDSTPYELSLKIVELISDPVKYWQFSKKAWTEAKKMSYDATCSEFFKIIKQQ